MSASTFRLDVDTPDPLAVVEIAGADYAIRMKGGQSIAYDAAPGLYIVRAKFRDHVEERLVRIHDKNERVIFWPPANSEVQGSADAEIGALSRQLARSRAPWSIGSWTKIAIKGLKAPRSRELDYPGVRVSDFFMCDLSGRPVQSFNTASLEQSLPESASPGVYPGEVASIDLSPGWYALSMPGYGQTRVMLPLYVSSNFSPTIFVETNAASSGEVWLDFDKLLVSYDPDEHTANDLRELRAIEAARRSLELGRNTLAPSLMKVLLQGKMMNPMLGLLALQMLLLPDAGSRKTKPSAAFAELFQQVLDNVSALLQAPDHPDLVLARAQARRLKWPVNAAQGDDMPLSAPPLLRANWQFLNAMSSRRSELTDRSGLLYDVGRSLLQAGIWVVWKPPVGERSISYVTKAYSLSAPSESLLMRQSWQDYPRLDAIFADDSTRLGRPRKKRKTPDEQLEVVVDLIRNSTALQAALREELSAVPPRGSVLDRTVARAALQLANFNADVELSVPKGYVSQLARNLSVPRSLVSDSITKVEKALKTRDGESRGVRTLTNDIQYLLS